MTGGWKQKTPESGPPANSSSVSALARKGIDVEKVYVRDSTVTFLDDSRLYDIVWPYIHAANARANWNFDWDYTEDFQFTKYNVGQFYGWHADASDKPYRKPDPEVELYHTNADGTPMLDLFGEKIPEDHAVTTNENLIGKIRKLSVTISLSDPSEYKGGNLRFDFGPHRKDRYHTCKEIRPRGSMIVFPSHIQHQVTPVTFGTRYSLVAWNLGKPFR
jgi:PKHD-type hydroxylase